MASLETINRKNCFAMSKDEPKVESAIQTKNPGALVKMVFFFNVYNLVTPNAFYCSHQVHYPLIQ